METADHVTDTPVNVCLHKTKKVLESMFFKDNNMALSITRQSIITSDLDSSAVFKKLQHWYKI